MLKLIDSPRSLLRGIIDPVKDCYINLAANPSAKQQGTGLTRLAKLTDSVKSSARPMRSPGFNTTQETEVYQSILQTQILLSGLYLLYCPIDHHTDWF